MEHPIEGICCSGPWPVSATCFIASNKSRRALAINVVREASSTKKIGCALSTVGASDFLCRIDHVWEDKAVPRGECLHVVE
jgi:hypothetical protein